MRLLSAITDFFSTEPEKPEAKPTTMEDVCSQLSTIDSSVIRLSNALNTIADPINPNAHYSRYYKYSKEEQLLGFTMHGGLGCPLTPQIVLLELGADPTLLIYKEPSGSLEKHLSFASSIIAYQDMDLSILFLPYYLSTEQFNSFIKRRFARRAPDSVAREEKYPYSRPLMDRTINTLRDLYGRLHSEKNSGHAALAAAQKAIASKKVAHYLTAANAFYKSATIMHDKILGFLEKDILPQVKPGITFQGEREKATEHVGAVIKQCHRASRSLYPWIIHVTATHLSLTSDAIVRAEHVGMNATDMAKVQVIREKIEALITYMHAPYRGLDFAEATRPDYLDFRHAMQALKKRYALCTPPSEHTLAMYLDAPSSESDTETQTPETNIDMTLFGKTLDTTERPSHSAHTTSALSATKSKMS